VSQVGTPEELYDSPANEFVANFLGSGNIFSGLIAEVSEGNLMVSVNDNRFEIPGQGEVNSQIKFSVKPEDIIITDTPSPDWAQAELVSITPQVGSFKVILDFNGIPIIALTYDEELVKRLRANVEKTIAFAFKSESIIIF
jgi:ABC-type Fe3+/spermidine/putrescine transport system ATPase subunit